jgi:hypothetical protein
LKGLWFFLSNAVDRQTHKEANNVPTAKSTQFYLLVTAFIAVSYYSKKENRFPSFFYALGLLPHQIEQLK